MAKYHINPKTGSPNQCRATKGGCPFGGDDNHFPTQEAAAAEIERRLSSFIMPEAVSKKSTTSEKGAAKREIAALRGKIESAQRTFREKNKTLQAQKTVRDNLQTARAALEDLEDKKSGEEREVIDGMLQRSGAVISELAAEVKAAKKEVDTLTVELNELRRELAPNPTATTKKATSAARSVGTCGSLSSLSC